MRAFVGAVIKIPPGKKPKGSVQTEDEGSLLGRIQEWPRQGGRSEWREEDRAERTFENTPFVAFKEL